MSDEKVNRYMAVFFFGVVVGWISTFSLWFIWSFGLISGLLLGAFVGTATIFLFLIIQGLPQNLFRAHTHSEVTATDTVRSDSEKAAFRL